MKNSAETSSSFSLFSIDEHRLSVGLLVLFLLAITGYGLWLGIAPFLPEGTIVESGVPRKTIAESHVESEDWDKAIEVYNEILRDDSENGYAALGVAKTWEAQLQGKWEDYARVSSTTGSASAGDEILAEESQLFKTTTDSWNRLLDNARYQGEAYKRLAGLHCSRARVRKSKDELDEAVDVLDAMFEKGLTYSSGIEQRGDLRLLRNHSEYPRLVAEENKIKKQLKGPSFFRRFRKDAGFLRTP